MSIFFNLIDMIGLVANAFDDYIYFVLILAFVATIPCIVRKVVFQRV